MFVFPFDKYIALALLCWPVMVVKSGPKVAGQLCCYYVQMTGVLCQFS